MSSLSVPGRDAGPGTRPVVVRRAIRRLALALTAVFTLAGPAGAGEPAARADLLRLFDETVFGRDAAGRPVRSSVIRAAKPLEVRVHGRETERVLPFLEEFLPTLTGVTGIDLPLRVAAADAPVVRPAGQLQVHVVGQQGLIRVLRQSWISVELAVRVARGLCFFITLGRETVTGGIVVIQPGLPERTLHHCLAEELTQALGVFGDSQAVVPSLFNDLGVNDPTPLVTGPTVSDLVVLRALYDPAIAAGMPRETALVRAEAILPGLAAAVARGGAGALRP